jgi:hypothetical protein
MEEWKTDIISMSFSISKLDRDAIDAIDAINKKLKAIKDTVLFFAAASNSGENEGRTYPAKRPEVFAIHAAHGGGTAWADNPDPLLQDWNFTTLGMHVEAPSKNNETKHLSGTSMACPVAAGIAALVLEFCRQATVDDAQEEISQLALLLSKLGMEKIFLKMRNANDNTPPVKTARYPYLQPWVLLSLARARGDAVLARRRIATVINEALESLDS